MSARPVDLLVYIFRFNYLEIIQTVSMWFRLIILKFKLSIVLAIMMDAWLFVIEFVSIYFLIKMHESLVCVLYREICLVL